MKPAHVVELTKAGTSLHVLDFNSVFCGDDDTLQEAVRPSFHGKWKCIDTWGLETFLLEQMGVGFIQRKAAAKAPWPSWQFVQDADRITFTNFTAMGELQENYIVDGPEYVTIDGWKREIHCKATWEGDVLVIVRTGPEGRFREERIIDDQGHLQFTLSKLNPTTEEPTGSWGRTFMLAS